MDEVRTVLPALLLGTVLIGLIRVARGPTLADRLLVAQLFGTTGVAILLLLPGEADLSALRNVAIVFAILAPVTAVALARQTSGKWKGGDA